MGNSVCVAFSLMTGLRRARALSVAVRRAMSSSLETVWLSVGMEWKIGSSLSSNQWMVSRMGRWYVSAPWGLMYCDITMPDCMSLSAGMSMSSVNIEGRGRRVG